VIVGQLLGDAMTAGAREQQASSLQASQNFGWHKQPIVRLHITVFVRSISISIHGA